MPRKRQMTRTLPATKRGVAPKPTTLSDMSVKPVANGYTVTSTSVKGDIYVFDDIEKVFEFMRAKLDPTLTQKQVLDGI